MSSTDNNHNEGLADIGQQRQQQEAEDNNNLTSWRTRIESSIARSRKIRGGNYVQIATVDPTTNEPRCRTVVFRGFLPSQYYKRQKDEGDNNDSTHLTVATESKTDIHSNNMICDDMSCVMKMITDNRSNKVIEATTTNQKEQEQTTCEMVWWFAKSSEQYRIRGKLLFIGDENDAPDGNIDKSLVAARKEQWGNLSDKAREQFFWPNPNIDYTNDNEYDNLPIGGRDAAGKLLPPPKTFLLMLLLPIRVDYLRLTDNYRQIDEVGERRKNNDSGSKGDNYEWKQTRVNP